MSGSGSADPNTMAREVALDTSLREDRVEAVCNVCKEGKTGRITAAMQVG